MTEAETGYNVLFIKIMEIATITLLIKMEHASQASFPLPE